MCHGAGGAGPRRVLVGSSPASTGLTTARPPVPAGLAGGPRRSAPRAASGARRCTSGTPRSARRWIDMGDWKRPLHYGDVDGRVSAPSARRPASSTSARSASSTSRARTPARSSTGSTRTGSATCASGACATGRCSTTRASSSTTARSPGSAPERFFVSTTTGNLDAVDQWLRWWLAGVRSRRRRHRRDRPVRGHQPRRAAGRATILPRLTDARRLAARRCRTWPRSRATVAGIPAIILRIGFVGELGYEIHVPADYGAHLWDALMDAGRDARAPAVRRRGAARPAAREAARDRRPGHGRALEPARGRHGLARQGRQAGLHRPRRGRARSPTRDRARARS